MKLRRYAAGGRPFAHPQTAPASVFRSGRNSCCDFKVSRRIAGVPVRVFIRVRSHLAIGRLMRSCPAWRVLLMGLMVCNGWIHSAPAQASEARHALAMHGEPELPENFTRLSYADPAAPKGGRLVQGVLGTFDSLNPFIVRGIAPQSIRGYVVESLMARGYDEPFTLYGLLARKVETDPATQLRHVPSRPGGEILRREAGHRRRCPVLVATATRQGPPESPHLLREGCQGRSDRGQRSPLRSVEQR